MSDLPQDLINKVQEHTNFPWWNGKAYAEFKGYPQRISSLEQSMGVAIDDLFDVYEWLRDEKQYEKSDRLRAIIGRIAVTLNCQSDNHDLIRVRAKSWAPTKEISRELGKE